MATGIEREVHSFAEFYPLYLQYHSNRTNRRLHFLGLAAVPMMMLALVVTKSWWWLPMIPLGGYGCAWIGHFFFEHNKPAAFKHPLYGFLGDLTLFKDIVSGKIPF